MPKALGILNYFDTTYVNGSLRPTRRQPTGNGLTITVCRLPPTFLPITSNVHNASLTGSSRTTNVCESWNNSDRNLFRACSPLFGRQWTPYAKTRPRPGRLCISSAVINHSVNACVASERVCNSNCNSFAKICRWGA